MTRGQSPRVNVNETTPLLSTDAPKSARWNRSVLYRCLLCGFMVSLSFGVTQVPLIYVFRLMTCEAYYKKHPEPTNGLDRCINREIEASTATAVAILGFSTTLFGVANLFITGWAIKKLGVKSALTVQVFWPAVRLAIQNLGVMTGGERGILIVQCSQIITIVGGPTGYILALNSFVTEVVENKERTGSLGRLQGCTMFGTAIGFLTGGLINESFGNIAPFRVAFCLFLTSTLYVLLFLPKVSLAKVTVSQNSKGLSKFFGPLKMFTPQKWILRDGRVQKEYGTILLGVGVFLGVLATGYIPTLLQMYSTDVLGFGPTDNGYLISVNSLLRGLFLTLAFPMIITAGRKHIKNQTDSKNVEHQTTRDFEIVDAEIPIEANQISAVDVLENEEEPDPPKLTEENENFEFDLMYTKYSLVADGILTGAATFVRKGWQLYLVAIFLPFAAGTGSAAKGTILQMCPQSDRADALSAITLVDMMARLSTTSLFGLVFAAFAGIGKTHLVFACNAAVALLGFFVLTFSRFPPEGSKRYEEETTFDAS